MRALIAAFLALPAVAQDAPEGVSVTYDCAGGAVLQAAYINPPGGESYAVVAYDGRLIPMKSGPTGSGVRYVSLDGRRRWSGTPRATTASWPGTPTCRCWRRAASAGRADR